MRADVVEIPRIKWETQRKLGLDKSFREAVRDHLRETWPSGTAKHAARAYGLSVDKAREAAAGRASLTSIERIFKRGGPPVFLPILEEVWGERLARYFAEMRETYEQHGARLAAITGAWGDLGADRDSVGSDCDLPTRDGRRAFSDRSAERRG